MTDEAPPEEPESGQPAPVDEGRPGYVVEMPTPGEDLSFECPRCKSTVAEMYYGPCVKCRGELRLAYDSVSRDVVAEAYEPKMNVTPNAVASKE